MPPSDENQTGALVCLQVLFWTAAMSCSSVNFVPITRGYIHPPLLMAPTAWCHMVGSCALSQPYRRKRLTFWASIPTCPALLRTTRMSYACAATRTTNLSSVWTRAHLRVLARNSTLRIRGNAACACLCAFFASFQPCVHHLVISRILSG